MGGLIILSILIFVIILGIVSFVFSFIVDHYKRKHANEEKTMIKSETNSDGSFELTNLNYKDSVEFFIQAATQKDNRDLMIKLEDFVSPKFNSQNIYNESNRMANCPTI